jgi:predicted NAD/FAD-dependent oxidoreductase
VSATTHDFAVIGAGISGLTLARELQRQGFRPIVLERARGVGGRCATRRVDGQAVDHGVAFLHGRSARFQGELASLTEDAMIEHWPSVRDGEGSPCRPEAFSPFERRVALTEGVNRFAKHLARGLDVRLGANVTVLRTPESSSHAGTWELTLTTGERLHARSVAITVPAPSCIDLLETMSPLPDAVTQVLPLLRLIRMVPCLAVIASYDHAPSPTWDVSFPRSSTAIHSILHDSGKRTHPRRLTLVVQARPAYSRAHLLAPAEGWCRALLGEVAALHGAWAASPDAVQTHVWKHARVVSGSELAQPVIIHMESGPVLGIAGDGFHPAGGVEGAYLSGLALAARCSELLNVLA